MRFRTGDQRTAAHSAGAAVTGFDPDVDLLLAPENLAHFLFLGVVTFALCFAT